MMCRRRCLLFIFVMLLAAGSANTQTTEFTYQGRLLDGSLPPTANYDLEFRLFSAETGGTLLGSESRPAVAVANGVFTVRLDFGAIPEAFDGADRWLEIAVRPAGGPTFTTLNPRQPISSAPYSIRSRSSDTANTAANSTQLGGVAAGQYVITTDPRMSDPRTPLAGSADYIQSNPPSQQASSSFNISGTGTADIFNAATQFNIGGSRILSSPGNLNLFAGVGSGAATSSGNSNSFFGNLAGQSNSTGSNNTLFGRAAGSNIVSGSGNSFFGRAAGAANTASSNSFFGDVSGASNNSGTFNSFFGAAAGNANTSGSFNSFFGHLAGTSNVTSGGNSYFGYQAGMNSTGNTNTFVGFGTGLTNTAGASNTLVGASSNVGANNLTYATAIGARSSVGTSDTIVLGKIAGNYDGTPRPADTVQIPGTLNVTGPINGTVLNATNATNATTAINALSLGGVAANLFVQTNDTRLTDDRNPTPGSTNYIQNTAVQQAASFNVGGTGRVGGGLVVGDDTYQTTARLKVGVFNAGGPAFVGANMSFGQIDGIGIEGSSINNPGFGTGGNFFGGRTGVAAESQAGDYSGFSYGVHASARGTNGFKVGVFGLSSAFPGTSVGYGVYGLAEGAGAIKYGVYGEANGPGTNWAGYFVGNTFVNGNLGIGTVGPNAKLHVAGNAILNGPVGIGTGTPESTLHVAGFNEILSTGPGAGIKFRDRGSSSANDDWNWYSTGNVTRFWRAGIGDLIGITTSGNVGIGNTNPQERLNVNGNVALLLASGGGTNVCQNSQLRLATCSSSVRYKQNINSFRSGLDLINRLRPVTFNWKEGNKSDMGLVAEEVAEVEPLLATYNEKGEVEGVKYDRIGVVLVNAVKEQQAQIEAQQKQIESQEALIKAQQQQMTDQQAQIDGLKQLVCRSKSYAQICQ